VAPSGEAVWGSCWSERMGGKQIRECEGERRERQKGGKEPSESKKLLTLWKGIVGGPTNMNGGRYLGPFQTIFF
jgi:hypothetical protein